METVEDHSDIWVIGAPDHLPSVAMVVDEKAPGEGFVADANLALGGAFAKRREIVRCPVDASKRCRRAVRANEHHVDSHLLHHVEFALRAIDGALPLASRHAFEVAERLIER